TVMVPLSIMYGNETVRDTMEDDFTGTFVKQTVLQEINATLDLPEKEISSFANDVFDRFRNPFIKHQLSSIALNSVSKFKVRVLPSILSYEEKYKELPVNLTYAFACLIRSYKGECNGNMLPVQADAKMLTDVSNTWDLNGNTQIATKLPEKRE